MKHMGCIAKAAAVTALAVAGLGLCTLISVCPVLVTAYVVSSGGAA